MERCPNCGAPARPGAKFCTTCGHRLPDVAAASQPEATNGPHAATSSSTWSTDDEVIPASGGAAEAAAGTDSIVEEEVAGVGAAAGSAASVDDQPVSADQVLSSSWPESPTASASWSSSWETVSGTGESADDQAAPAQAVAEEAEATGWPVPPTTEVAETEVEIETGAEPEPTGAPSIVLGHPLTPSPEANLPAQAPAATAGSPVDRATAIIDELRALIPALMGASADVDLAAIAGDLEASITPAGDQEAVDRRALREAITAARDRPRDIDTMLDLSQRVDAVIALIDAHDRCVAAIERAVATLRNAPTRQT